MLLKKSMTVLGGLAIATSVAIPLLLTEFPVSRPANAVVDQQNTSTEKVVTNTASTKTTSSTEQTRPLVIAHSKVDNPQKPGLDAVTFTYNPADNYTTVKFADPEHRGFVACKGLTATYSDGTSDKIWELGNDSVFDYPVNGEISYFMFDKEWYSRWKDELVKMEIDQCFLRDHVYSKLPMK